MNMIGQYYQGGLSKTSFLWILRYFGSFPSDAPYLSKIYAEEVCETIVSSFWAFFQDEADFGRMAIVEVLSHKAEM